MSYRSTGINPKTNPLDGSRSRPTNRSEYKDLPQQNEGDGGVPPPPRARSASRLNANSSNLREKHEDMKTRSPPPPPRSGAPTVNADYSPKSGESQYQPGSSSGSGRSRGDTSEEHRSTRASESGAPERDKVKKTGNSSDKRSKLGNRDDTKIITSSKGRGREKGEKGEKGEKDTKKEVKDPSKDPSRFIGKNTLQYALWAHRMSYISAGMCLVMGAFAVAWTGATNYGCKIDGESIHENFLYNVVGACPSVYINAANEQTDVCCVPSNTESELVARGGGSESIGALYILYSFFLVFIEDINTLGIGYGMYFPNDSWFYDMRFSPLGLLHVIVGFIGWGSYGTCLAGVCLIINGGVYIEATRRMEAGDGGRAVYEKTQAKQKEQKAKNKKEEEDELPDLTCSSICASNGVIWRNLYSFWVYFKYLINLNPLSQLYRIYNEDKLAAYFWSFLFFLANILMFSITYNRWSEAVEAQKEAILDGSIDFSCSSCGVARVAVINGPFSSAAPLAKACGGCLNLNCALLLLPVIKTLLRKLNNLASSFNDLQDNTDYFSKFFSHSFARYVPIQKNIEFHKMCAFSIALFSVGHIIGHYANLMTAYEVTLENFQKWGWTGTSYFTGAIVTIAMFVIYSAAADIIRHTKFEIFFSAHHMFVVFYLIMFLHGPVFYAWAIVPVLLYSWERYQQTKKGGKPFQIIKVEYIAPVMGLYFKPVVERDFSFKEGQYLYLNCPHISESEWHPFTISSAQDDMINGPRIHIDSGEEVMEVPRPNNLHPNAKWNKYCLLSQNWKELNPNEYLDKSETSYFDYISCHIKIHGLDDPVAKSWTRKFKEYLEVLAGNPVGTNNFPFFYNRVDHRGDTIIGRVKDGENKNILRVDGPHAAPSEHFTMYGTTMLVGGGIGLTPCASIITALIRHRWRRGASPEILHLYWIVRQAEVDSFQWLIHLLTELSYDYKKGREDGTIDQSFYCEFNIFVTSAAKDPIEAKPLVRPKKRLGNEKVSPTFVADELYDNMLNPQVSSKIMVQTMKKGGRPPNRLQDVWVWNGRPDWSQIFADMKDQRQHSEIGVAFCGAPVIGNELKTNCEKYSSTKDDCLFTLHKENF